MAFKPHKVHLIGKGGADHVIIKLNVTQAKQCKRYVSLNEDWLVKLVMHNKLMYHPTEIIALIVGVSTINTLILIALLT